MGFHRPSVKAGTLLVSALVSFCGCGVPLQAVFPTGIPSADGSLKHVDGARSDAVISSRQDGAIVIDLSVRNEGPTKKLGLDLGGASGYIRILWQDGRFLVGYRDPDPPGPATPVPITGTFEPAGPVKTLCSARANELDAAWHRFEVKITFDSGPHAEINASVDGSRLVSACNVPFHALGIPMQVVLLTGGPNGGVRAFSWRPL
jgi:hypothetical protein